jgi:ribosomal protein RSM22 (predicted rRNA methylase)
MLDFGSGPGTAIWSARSIWGENLKDITAVEPSSAMSGISEKILKGFEGIHRRRFLYTGKDSMKYDLVTASYVLSELKDDEERKMVMRNLWKNTQPGGVMVRSADKKT